MKHLLKRYDAVVICARVARGLGEIWRTTAAECREEKQRQGALAADQQAVRAYFDQEKVRKLQIGAGTNLLAGWLNADLEPVNDQIVHLDAAQPFPFEDEGFDFIFSEHMIEHIHYRDGLRMLRECFRVMKPGGRIRVATPDVEQIVALLAPAKTEAQERYLRWSSVESIGLYNSARSELQKRRKEWDLDPDHFTRYFPDPGKDSACFVVNNFFRSYGHLFLYDALTLGGALRASGFAGIARFHPGESGTDHLRGIEVHSRLIGDEMNRYETLVLEAARPER